MIVLHGGTGNAAHMERTAGMNEIADYGGFLVAYPEGTGGRFPFNRDRRTWNAGSCCGAAARENVDDVRFIRTVIEDLQALHAIDERRIYVAGMSNGAMMAYRLACEMPGRIAAVVAVSGTLAVENCDAAKDVPILHIHGDQDQNVPYAGGRGKESVTAVFHRSVMETMDLLVRSRRCSTPERQHLPGGILALSYRCSGGAPVELYVINGGGHVWPGGRGDAAADRGVSASRLAWEFARQFTKGVRQA
jgi:polyhydroxybutyrate depolymerase